MRRSRAPGMGKNTTVTYTEQGDKIKVTVDGVDKNGKPTHSVWVSKFDGKAYPAKGNLPYNSVAYKVVNDRTNDITEMKDGKIRSSGRISVSADGKSRTVTIDGTDENGKKLKAKAVQDKAQVETKSDKGQTRRIQTQVSEFRGLPGRGEPWLTAKIGFCRTIESMSKDSIAGKLR